MGWKDWNWMTSCCHLPNFCSNNNNNNNRGVTIEIELGAHTIKSHGAALARNHMHDWIILMLLGVIVIILNVIHPFYRFVGEDMMVDLKYPMKDNTVPVWAVPLYAVLLPITIFILFYFRRKDVYDLHHSILGLLFAVLITGVLTDAIKDAVGRARPDFYWRCFPNGNGTYDKWGNVECYGKDSDIKEGHKSFPSGHTSWSFAGLGFLSLYLAGKIKVFDRRGHVAKLCIVVLPLLLASLVAVSRVDDYWHHWQDVFAGGLLGLVVATVCYRQFFPPPYDSDGADLRTNPFQEGENDAILCTTPKDILKVYIGPVRRARIGEESARNYKERPELEVANEPITRARAKLLKETICGLINELQKGEESMYSQINEPRMVNIIKATNLEALRA